MKERSYGIDLLRIVLMYMVCVLHTLWQGGIIGACEKGTLEHKVYWFVGICFYCAVDSFALISGYVSTGKSRKTSRIIEMWFQAFFYSFVVTLVLSLIGLNPEFTFKNLIISAFPVTFNAFWYFTAYFVLFFTIPIIDKFAFSLNDSSAKKTLLIIVVLFSIIGIFRDPFKAKGGYSAIWLMALYFIGVLAKRIKIFENKKTAVLICIMLGCILITWGLTVIANISFLTSYVSPTIVLTGLIQVVLFSRLKLKGKLIKHIAPLTFGIYLFHYNGIIWNFILKDAFSFVVSENICTGILLLFGFSAGIFLTGLFVEALRNIASKKSKIPELSSKIAAFLSQILKRISSILE